MDKEKNTKTVEQIWQSLHADNIHWYVWNNGRNMELAPNFYRDLFGNREGIPEFENSNHKKEFAIHIATQFACQIDMLSGQGIDGFDFLVGTLLYISYNADLHQESLGKIFDFLSPHAYLLVTETAIKQYEVDTKEFGWNKVMELVEAISAIEYGA